MTHDIMNCGVYIITAPSGNQYIGSAKNIKKRWASHRQTLRRDIHKNEPLQRAWKKYNGELVFKKLLVCRAEDLLLFEQCALNALNPLYNINRVAGNSTGRACSPETRNKIKLKLQDRTFSEEHRKNLSVARKLRVIKKETRIKTSQSLKNRKRTEKHQKNLTASLNKPETREKLRAANRRGQEKRKLLAITK